MLLGRFYFSRMSLSKSESAVEVYQICSSCLLEAYLQNQTSNIHIPRSSVSNSLSSSSNFRRFRDLATSSSCVLSDTTADSSLIEFTTKPIPEACSLDHPDLSYLDIQTNVCINFDAKARLTEISLNDMIGLKNISLTTF